MLAEIFALTLLFGECATMQGEEANPQEVRIEASSENDLFFHYTHVYVHASYAHYDNGFRAWPEYRLALAA